jgi:Squalene-hopene cyclase C-terminal domain
MGVQRAQRWRLGASLAAAICGPLAVFLVAGAGEGGVAPSPPVAAAAATPAGSSGNVAPKAFSGGDSIGEIELTPEARKWIRKGLSFLASRQNIDGSWDTEYRRNTGVISVALLAFLASGNPPGRGEYGVASAKGLNWLLKQAKPSGMIVCQSSHGPMYEHALSTLYLAEVWGQTRRPEVKDKLKRAVNLIVNAQNKNGQWSYQPIPHGGDLSVTIMQVMALRAAHDAGIAVPKKTIDRAIGFVRRCHNKDGGYNYQGRGPSSVALTAAGACSLQFAGDYSAKQVQDGLEYLLKKQKGGFGHYWYTSYYAVHAFYFAGGDYWKRWYPESRSQILKKLKRYRNGSHDGRILDTGWAVMCLSLPHRYLPIYQR